MAPQHSFFDRGRGKREGREKEEKRRGPIHTASVGIAGSMGPLSEVLTPSSRRRK